MKLLTVSIAAYNVEAYLEKCLASFADERLAEGLEVLIVNDGSKDATADIARRFEAAYPAIFRLIDKENGGHGSTVNAGMREARGKYFRVVDGDDWVNTEQMVTLLDKLRTIDTDMVVDQRRTVHMVTGEECPELLPADLPFEQSLPFLDYSSEELCERYNLHTVSVKTDLLRRYGITLREHIFYVDFEFILKATARCETVTFLDLDIYRYLIGNSAQSVDSQNYVRRIAHHREMTEEMLRFATQSGFDGPLKDYVDYRVMLLLHTHYNIALIFNKNRREGGKYGREFYRFLKQNYPAFARMTAKRYHITRLLHLLGVDYDRLQTLKRA